MDSIHPKSVLTRTAKAIREPNSAGALGAAERSLLAIIDGKRTYAELKSMAEPARLADFESVLAKLMVQELVQCIPYRSDDDGASLRWSEHQSLAALAQTLNFTKSGAIPVPKPQHNAQPAKPASAERTAVAITPAAASIATVIPIGAATTPRVVRNAAVDAEREADVRSQLVKALTPKISAELRASIESEQRARMESELRAQLAVKLRPAIEAELWPKIETELRDKLATVLRPTIEIALRQKLDTTLRPQIEAELRASLEASVRSEIEAREQARQAEAQANAQSELRSAIAHSAQAQTNARALRCVQASVDAMICADRGGVLTDVNPAFCALAGITAEEVIGHQVETLFGVGERAAVGGFIAQIAAGEAMRNSLAAQLVCGSEVPIPIEIRAAPMLDEAGSCVGVSATLCNVAPLLELGHEHERAQGRITTLLEHLKAGVAIVDRDGSVVQTNQTFCDMFGIAAAPYSLEGLPQEELVASASANVASAQSFRRRIQELSAAGSLSRVESVQLKDGGRLNLRVIPLILDSGPDGHILLFQWVSVQVSSPGPVARTRA